MNNNRYLIPANSKKSILYFGLFNKFDLVLFGSGVGLSLLLVMILNANSFLTAMMVIAPGVVTGFLVFPVPNYHNVLTLLISLWRFFTSRERFVWKGWCVKDEFKETDEK